MAADDLPEKFDVIVIGTGLPESILAAAFSRVGYTVLHIDRNDYYCGDWAAFNLQGLERWLKEEQGDRSDPLKRPTADKIKLEDGDLLVECPLYRQTNSNIETGLLVSPGEEKGETPVVQLSSLSLHGSQEAGTVSNSEITTGDGSENVPTGNDDSNKGDIKDGVGDDQATGSQVKEAESTGSGDHLKSEHSEQADTSEQAVSETSSLSKGDESSAIDATEGCPADVQQEEKKAADEDKCKAWTKPDIERAWRKFNLDLAPRLLYCRGDMVELLINSDVSKYCEFKTVTRVLTYLNEELQKVPCSRADVFSSKSVSMIEKRMMMKFITFCMDYQKQPEEYQDFSDKPFSEFLDSKKLKPNIRHFIEKSIAMATDKITTLEGLGRTQKFILSLGRYGNTAFLWPLYGSGELPQSFARMCAVFGGIYCLRITASSLIVDENNKYRGIITTEGHRIESKWLISEYNYLPQQYLPANYGKKLTSRAILMTDKSVLPSDSEQLTLLHLPCPDDLNRPVSVIELCPSSMASPQGIHIVHLTREAADEGCTPRQDLNYAVDLLFSQTACAESKPHILWYLYFSQCNSKGVKLESEVPDNVIGLPGPGPELDMDQVVIQIKELFSTLCPDEEFLPKAPNPEDIIYDDGQATEPGQSFQADPTDSEVGSTQDVESGDRENTQELEDRRETGDTEETKACPNE